MKILQLTQHFYPFFGGVEMHVFELSRRIVSKGFDVEVVCAREPDTLKQEIVDGIKIHRFNAFEPIKLKYGVSQIIPQMIEFVLNTNADIVHAHGYGFFPTWASIFSNKPRIITTHSDPTARIYPFWDMLRAIPVRMCDRVVATTHMERHRLIEIGVKPERITVIPNGVTLPPLDVPNADFPPIILCLARLDIIHKGQDILLQAMPKILSRIPDVKLWIAGEGSDLGMLRKIAKKLNIDESIEFKESIDGFTKALYLKNCGVLCVSPRTESFGVIYLEAMAYGRPIITTRVGGIPEVIGDAAILVPPNDPSSLADALIQILTDEALADDLGKRGLERVKQFDWDVLVKKYEALYKEVA